MSDHSTVSLREASSAPELFVRPRLVSTDLLAYFWLAKWWMLMAGLPILLAGLIWAARMPDQPVASTRVIASTPAGPASHAQLLHEARALKDAEQAMRDDGSAMAVPVGTLSVGVQRNRSALALRLDGARLPAPEASLDAVVTRYLDTMAGPAPAAEPLARSDEGIDPLEAAAEARRAFIEAHGISDFDAEMDRLNSILQAADTARVNAEAEAAALAQRRTMLDRQLRDTPETVAPLGADTLAADIDALRRERERLLARYTPQSIPVQSIDRQIDALTVQAKSGAAGGPAQADAVPNPAHRALQQDRADADAALAAARARVQTLDARREDAAASVRALAALEPEWRQITRQLDGPFTVPGAGATSTAAPSERPRMVASGPAQLTNRAKPMRRSLRIGAIALSFFIATLAGIVYARTRKTFATPNSVARTLNRPAIAAIPRKR